MSERLKLKWVSHQDPIHAPDYDEWVINAVVALKSGVANEGQQQLVWDYIQYLTGTGDWEDLVYRPGGNKGARDTAFVGGKQFVGLALRKLTNPLTLDALLTKRDKEDQARDSKRKS